MEHKFVLTALLLTFGQFTFAQSNVPVVGASSKIVDIRDGNHFKKGNWYIFPERNPDYYYVEIPEKPHRITFITNLDSISFDMEYGVEYDFVILLDGKDSCYTRISATYKNLDRYTRKRTAPRPDTLSFTLGDNDEIYLKGRVNSSQPLDIQFDLGAESTVIKKSSVKKVKMKFDNVTSLSRANVIRYVPNASQNHLEMGNLVWDSVAIALPDTLTCRTDLVIGNSLFKNKILQIDYDQKIMVVYDALPDLDAHYSKHDIILDRGTVPFVKGSLSFGARAIKAWMMFDTETYTTVPNGGSTPTTNKLLGKAKRMIGLDDKQLIPKLNIGDYEFTRFNYAIQNLEGDSSKLTLGYGLLKQFNFVLDSRNGHLYLKPNSLSHEPSYKSPEYFMVRIVPGLLILFVGIVVCKKMRNN